MAAANDQIHVIQLITAHALYMVHNLLCLFLLKQLYMCQQGGGRNSYVPQREGAPGMIRNMILET